MADVNTKDSIKVSLPFLGAAMTVVALLVTMGMCPRVSDIRLSSDAKADHKTRKAEHIEIEARAEKAHGKLLKRIEDNQETLIDLLTAKPRRR